jgi:transcriptional regulator with XRE-family HTH domain
MITLSQRDPASTPTHLKEAAGLSNDYARELGARLRAIRQQQGLSLQAVEEKSQGRWKAVVIGSYERGDRAVTVYKLSDLATFYGVPVEELLPGGTAAQSSHEAPDRLILDLSNLQDLDAAEVAPLARYAKSIQRQRGDYNGRVLSIRQEDLRTLAVIYEEAPSVLANRLTEWGVLRSVGSAADQAIVDSQLSR